VAAVTFGVVGIAFHGVLAALLLGALETADIEWAFMSVFALLLIFVVAMLLRFRRRLQCNDKVAHHDDQ
tara:strand:- start:726 stop:932 length:207 start_codon:yes stop_codon:yes gene_type:complete